MIPDNQDSRSDLHITTEEKLPPISPPLDPKSNTSIISISDQLRKEQKQLDELMAQQNQLLEQAKMFRERVDEKLALHESFKSSRNDSRINNEKTGIEESFLNEISFQSLPKVYNNLIFCTNQDLDFSAITSISRHCSFDRQN
jgi:hypothetical protein